MTLLPDALLSCPFCGATPQVVDKLFDVLGKLHNVSCRCDVYFDCREPSEAEAIAAWNTRALQSTQPPSADVVRRLEAWQRALSRRLTNQLPPLELTNIRMAELNELLREAATSLQGVDGWRLVPVEPTYEMLDAALPGEAGKSVSAARAKFIGQYKAALSASPLPGGRAD